MARRCCCGCRTTRELDAAGNFTTGTGGTITANGIGFDVSGEVSPVSLISAEAYLISFTMTGSVSIDIGGDTVAADATAQTITAGLNTVACGRSTETPLELDVYIRVTPSHICIWAIGNYFDASSSKYAYGILTIDRTGDVPTSITATWTSAYFEGFTIADSSTTVSGTIYEPSYDKLCFTAPSLACPFLFHKVMTSDFAETHFLGGYRALPDITILGDDPFTGLSGGTLAGYIGAAYWGSYDETDTYPDPLDDTIRQWGTPIGCIRQSYAAKWYELQSAPASPRYITGLTSDITRFCICTFIFELQWPTPTVSTPYPKPVFYARLWTSYSIPVGCYLIANPSVTDTASYVSGGDVNTTFDVNDLLSGFTLSATATDQSAANDPDPSVWTCNDGDDPPAALPGNDLSLHVNALLVGAEWSFTP